VDLAAVETIDGSFVPRRSPVASVELDGETVVAGRGAGGFFRLDPVASLVWSCLDGSGTADEIARDLAVELGAPPAVVTDGVVDLIRTLGRMGCIEGVGGDGPASVDTSPGGVDAVVGRHLAEPPNR
jgi:hypothetical protein